VLAKALAVSRTTVIGAYESLASRGAAANDVNMLVNTGGRQRSEAEFRALYEAAGFELLRIVPTQARVSVIEGRRV
jgi:DNA-binding transcriptional MocR family regulator